ncbi:MAG: hypothetical protein ACO1Q7_05240 [Gemmatimonas sp.]
MMRPDGGEAQRITDAKDGVGTFVFTRDGKSLVYSRTTTLKRTGTRHHSNTFATQKRIPDPRNQLVKSVAGMAWMDKWIRRKGDFR